MLLLVLVPQVECQTIIHKITYWAQISAMEYIWNPAKHHTHCFSRHQKLTSKYLVLITLFLRVFSYILIIWFACMSKRGIMQVFRITLQLPILQPVMARFFFYYTISPTPFVMPQSKRNSILIDSLIVHSSLWPYLLNQNEKNQE